MQLDQLVDIENLGRDCLLGSSKIRASPSNASWLEFPLGTLADNWGLSVGTPPTQLEFHMLWPERVVLKFLKGSGQPLLTAPCLR